MQLFLQTKCFHVLHGVVLVDVVIYAIAMNGGCFLMAKGGVEVACKQKDGAGTEYEGCEPFRGTSDETVAGYEQDEENVHSQEDGDG